ncbi:HalOD1 output domain-containing protein [Halomicrococcus sp. NG-SE-24]|uniref:HalOD1 output domain-containing protein n=1 Tax=Halomicrococcus sp. NG-SE-24 TaxID=3436928 RepID=UPI003D991BF7
MTDNEQSQRRPANSRRFDGSADDSLKTRIISHVAAQKNVDSTSLEPLYEAIDPDALEDLFAPHFDGTSRTTGRVVFAYSGYRVTVTSDGDIQTTPLENL